MALKIQQQAQRLKQVDIVDQIGLVDQQHRVPLLFGVGDQTAFNGVPGPVLGEVCNAEFLLEAQSNIPTLIWTGLLKFHREDGQTYYTTRGFERFGKPNLAFLAPTGQGEQATELFHTLLNYQHFYDQTFGAGHTAELGGQMMRFDEPHEYAEYLSGGLPVLVVSVTG